MSPRPATRPGPRIVRRARRVYFVDAEGGAWLVMDCAMGPPHAPPFRTVVRAPGWPQARERIFLRRRTRGDPKQPDDLRCLSFWLVNPDGGLLAAAEQRLVEPDLLAAQLARAGVPVKPRDWKRREAARVASGAASHARVPAFAGA
jgi:hypothetical protein